MSPSKERQDELFSMIIAARRRDAKQLKAEVSQPTERGPPTPRDDAFTDFLKSLSPEQRELFRAYLESPD